MWCISSSESESRSESSSEANGRNFSVGATNDAMCGARCSIRRPLCSAGGPMTCFRTMSASFAQQQYRLSMAAEASEIQWYVSVAINRVRGAPREPFVLYIEEPAHRRCISIDTGLVKLLVRLVGLTEKRHDCLTGPILINKPRPTRARRVVCSKKMWSRFRGLASSKTLGNGALARAAKTTLQTRTTKRFRG